MVQGSEDRAAQHHDTNPLLPPLHDSTETSILKRDCSQAVPALTYSNHGSNDTVDYLVDRWMARFQELLEYREKVGHCRVPHN
jgi:hypothetical protein